MDVMKATYPTMIAMFLQATGIFGFTYFSEPRIFFLSALIFGLGYGSCNASYDCVLSKNFGSHNLGKARGISSPIVATQPIEF